MIRNLSLLFLVVSFTSCSFFKGLYNKANAATKCSVEINSMEYGLSIAEQSSALVSFLVKLNISIINPTDEDLYLARYRIYVTADGKEFFLLDKAENTPVFAGDDNPMDLKLSVNPLTSIGLAFKKFKGKPIDYDFEGYIWLDYRGLEIPIPVKGHKRIAL